MFDHSVNHRPNPRPSDLQREIGEWCARTFPNGTFSGELAHLARELAELREAIDAYTAGRTARGTLDIADELADCLILLMAIAHRARVDLYLAARVKHHHNLSRQWGEPDAEGVTEHLRQPQP